MVKAAPRGSFLHAACQAALHSKSLQYNTIFAGPLEATTKGGRNRRTVAEIARKRFFLEKEAKTLANGVPVKRPPTPKSKSFLVLFFKKELLFPRLSSTPRTMRIDITDALSIDAAELEISFIQASGPGGQNVNKVATAAQLRFDARHSLSLPNDVKVRLQALAGQRLTRDGVIVMTGRQHRTQERNRQDVTDRLIELIRAACVRPVRRRATKPSFGERQRRLEAKSHRAGIKKGRSAKTDD